MLRTNLICIFALSIGGSLLLAQDDAKLASGPKAGAYMPAAFECFNINGPAKGRPHCLVCKFGLSPAVLIFAREPVEGKDEAFNELLKKLDETAAEFDFRNFAVGVVILSPDARDSTNNAQEEKSAELIKEAVKREKLLERLEKRAEPLKNVIVAYHLPEGPKKYNLNPKAAVTILFYERLKITDNWAFAPAALQDKDVKAIMKRVSEALPSKKKVEEK